jgi:hypothetical protein
MLLAKGSCLLKLTEHAINLGSYNSELGICPKHLRKTTPERVTARCPGLISVQWLIRKLKVRSAVSDTTMVSIVTPACRSVSPRTCSILALTRTIGTQDVRQRTSWSESRTHWRFTAAGSQLGRREGVRLVVVANVVEFDATVAHSHDARHAFGERGVVSNHDDSGAVFTIDLEEQLMNRITGRTV